MAHMPVKLLTRAINGAINCSREASEEGKRYECFRALAAPRCQPFCFVADTPLCVTCAAWQVSPHVLSRPGCFRGLLKALRPTRLNPNILWAVFRAHRSNDTFIYSYGRAGCSSCRRGLSKVAIRSRILSIKPISGSAELRS